MKERRKNGSVRDQAQQWFEALRAHCAAEQAQNDLAERLKTWATLEQLMQDCPRLLPPLMTMAWQLRAHPSFAPFFQGVDGQLANEKTMPLAGCAKSFDDVVLAHLHGAVRLYCKHQEEAWLVAEKERNKPTGLAATKLFGPLIRKLTHQEDKDLLARYPQRGLYVALKPYLFHPRQFALIESLASLPTRLVAILRDATRGLVVDSGIRNLAALESSKCKFVVGLSRFFAETIIARAEETDGEAEKAALPPIQPAPLRENLGEIAGTALGYLTLDGLHLAKGAVFARDHARGVVEKMSVAMGYDIWCVFSDDESIMNVVHCPASLARALSKDATTVQRQTSDALNTIKSSLALGYMVSALLAAGGRERLALWASKPQCAGVWAGLAGEVNKFVTAHGESAFGPAVAADFCQTVVPSFATASGEEAAAVAAPAAERPATVAEEAPAAAAS